jgi:hypothetical protein
MIQRLSAKAGTRGERVWVGGLDMVQDKKKSSSSNKLSGGSDGAVAGEMRPCMCGGERCCSREGGAALQ